jgi:hypothetical protein
MMDSNNNEIGRSIGSANSHLSDNEIFDLVLNEVNRPDSSLILGVPSGGPETYKYGDGYGFDSCKK